MSKVLENFLRYISYDTQSQEDREEVPSTRKQFRLAEQLARELGELGAEEVRLDDHCYVYAAIPASPGKEGLPPLGFIAHMDTSPAVSGAGVKARIVESYDGGDIPLNDEGAVLSPGQYPSLLRYRGQDLVVTDGRTLLGADDKAGVAEIMAMAGVLLAHPELPHPPIRIAFPPTRRWAGAPTSLIFPASAPPMPIRWTAGSWGNWNTKTSTPPRPSSPSMAGASTPAPPRGRW